MFGDSTGTPLKIGDTVTTKDGSLCLIKDFLVYEIAVEILCEDKVSHEFVVFQLKEVTKIS